MDRPIFLKAASYCAYQERTQDEVRQRLKDWNVWGDDAEEIITELILENFLNEERFAKVFAGSKFRVKKWGRRKIIFELKKRRLSDYCIKAGMNEIDDEAYYETLTALIEKKKHDYRKEENEYKLNQKIAQFAVGKGYESNLIWEILREG
ncbi:MAG: RecX family transcriptional regulator [Spirosomaceae bacterium]|nr:RecX family transcriptional regulator [Spirosomataceae bacterium]